MVQPITRPSAWPPQLPTRPTVAFCSAPCCAYYHHGAQQGTHCDCGWCEGTRTVHARTPHRDALQRALLRNATAMAHIKGTCRDSMCGHSRCSRTELSAHTTTHCPP
eukprot:9950401-Alexandrium_andersonii.AAC.1